MNIPPKKSPNFTGPACNEIQNIESDTSNAEETRVKKTYVSGSGKVYRIVLG